MKTPWTLPFCVMVALVIGGGVSGVRSAQNPTKKGTVDRVKVHGHSLEGNLANETAAPEVTIYLPPSYAAERTRRYPVVYLLTVTPVPIQHGPGDLPIFQKAQTGWLPPVRPAS